MGQFVKASKLFSDDMDLKSYIETLSFIDARKKFFTAVKSSKIDTIFLVGDAGVGKTYLLNLLEKKSKTLKVAAHYSDMKFSDEDLLEDLLDCANVLVSKGEHSKNALIENVKKHYKNLEYIVLIDNVGDIDKGRLEFFRYLIKLGIVKFVFSCRDKNFSDEGLNSKTIKIGSITKDEIERYIKKELISNDLKNEAKMFNKKEISLIHRYSNANFKRVKDIVKTAFEIAQIASKKRLTEYATLNHKTLTMAAIDLGIIDVK